MPAQVLMKPDYVFEASWEVCHKVGGIYTVLSTRANVLQQVLTDRVFFIGPDLWKGQDNPDFTELADLYATWRMHACRREQLPVRIGRWNVPGKPIAILVDFTQLYPQKNEIYGKMWEWYGVDSLHAYGDYDEASMFAIAAGRVVESFYRFNLTAQDKVVFQAHEWMTGFSALYLQHTVPEVATIFTTHATSIGRSIAGNNKPLYDYLFAYNGDQMARELNMEAKHSVEKQTAHHVDCFTTVSEITDNECRELLDKQADVVLMNGFEDDFVPRGAAFTKARRKARQEMLHVANCLTGEDFGDDTLIIGTSGRYEFRNKGIDVFLESLKRLNQHEHLQKRVLAFVNVPAWVASPRADLVERLKSGRHYDTPLEQPFITHWLHNMEYDQTLGMLRYLNLNNGAGDKVKVIFVPCYLNGEDGIVNLPYYDWLIGEDLTVYASYYEPWGYTPLESIAFHVPTITTDLAGFGRWAQTAMKHEGIEGGVKVLHRTDGNYHEVADGICSTVLAYSQLDADQLKTARRCAGHLAEKALWKHFIRYYYNAYDLALQRAGQRISNTNSK